MANVLQNEMHCVNVKSFSLDILNIVRIQNEIHCVIEKKVFFWHFENLPAVFMTY